MIPPVESRPLNYQLFPNPPEDNCGYCRESLDDGNPVIAHEGNGTYHPIHRDCMEQWINVQMTCPTCTSNVQFDYNTLYSRSEKIKHTANKWFTNAKMFMTQTVRPTIAYVLVDTATAASVAAIARTTGISPLFIAGCLQTRAMVETAVRLGQIQITDRQKIVLFSTLPLALAAMVGSTDRIAVAALAMGAGAAIDKFMQQAVFTRTTFEVLQGATIPTLPGTLFTSIVPFFNYYNFDLDVEFVAQIAGLFSSTTAIGTAVVIRSIPTIAGWISRLRG